MELDGLEGNEDFWNMDLSDEEVSIKDLVPKHASKNTPSMLGRLPTAQAPFKADVTKDRQGTAAFSGGLNTNKQVEKKRDIFRPEKLPNGKYRYWYLIFL